jgi:hypothetical protein
VEVDKEKESSEARQVAVIVRYFRCLQEKEARQNTRNAVQRGRRKKRREETARRRIKQQPTRLTRPRVDAHTGIRPSSREIRLEKGTNQSNELART